MAHLVRRASVAVPIGVLLMFASGCPERDPPPLAEAAGKNGAGEAPVIRPSGDSGAGAGLRATGEAEALRFELALRPDPPRVGDLFEVITTITDTHGQPVEEAVFTLDARMPEHDHGMTTRPEHRPLGGGRYLSEGMRLHMHGRWTFVAEAATDERSDRAELIFDLPP